MSTTGKSADVLVDSFVRYANQAGYELKSADEVPQELRAGEWDGTFKWQIRPAAPNPWVEKFVQQLPHTLPKPYRSLIERYRFCSFEVGPLMLFANSGHDLFYELSTNTFKDKGLFPTLHKYGYLELGKAFGGNYDPVCFDTERQSRGDAPVVQLDHEEILTRGHIRLVQEIAPSFASFLQRVVEERLPVH